MVKLIANTVACQPSSGILPKSFVVAVARRVQWTWPTDSAQPLLYVSDFCITETLKGGWAIVFQQDIVPGNLVW